MSTCANAQINMYKKAIMPERNSFFLDEFETNYPHQPKCSFALSRRAGLSSQSGALSPCPTSPRVGFPFYGRNCTAESILTHTPDDSVRFRPPVLNKNLTPQIIHLYLLAKLILLLKLKRKIAFDNLIFPYLLFSVAGPMRLGDIKWHQ